MKLETHLSRNEYPDGFWLQSGEAFVLVDPKKPDEYNETVRRQGWHNVKKVEHEDGELSTIFI